jgi:glycosyltransferase involved in cell wall biosynthesis
MRIALVHDFLNQYGGAERVLEAIHELYPDATVYTSLYDPVNLPLRMRNWDIRPFRLPRFAGPLAKLYTFFYPTLFENLDLSDYDLVISSSASFAKGVITRPGTLHISYIHTPPRFLYHYPTETSRRRLWFLKPILAPLDNILRVWDFNAAQRPNFLLANSKETARRIKKFYGRETTVIYPPVGLSAKGGVATSGRVQQSEIRDQGSGRRKESTGHWSLATDHYFLVVSRLASYKRIDLAIEACSRLGLPLKIVGTGKEEKRLKRLAFLKPKGRKLVEFLGFVGDREVTKLYQNCRAFIFPGMEDFGITPIEAMSFGKPVIALGQGGALETVVEGKTGKFFDQETPESLMNALQSFNPQDYESEDCIAQAKNFSKERFQKEFREFVAEKMKKKKSA